MNTVAKLLIKNNDDFLMMYRSNHPRFGVDPDLPGGTAEGSEPALGTMIREVYEEIGLHIDKSQVREIFSSDTYSKNGTFYSLFITDMPNRPEVNMSWEHSSYEWVSKDIFISKAKSAKDTYMHMASDTLKSLDFSETS